MMLKINIFYDDKYVTSFEVHKIPAVGEYIRFELDKNYDIKHYRVKVYKIIHNYSTIKSYSADVYCEM